MKTVPALAAILMILAPHRAAADVADSSAGGFTIQTTLAIQAAPAEVYRRLLQIGDWWDSAHTWSGNAHNLSIEEKPMGCFCEKLVPQGGVRHMEVVFVAPGKTLIMTGGLGPLMSIAATGNLSIQLSPAEGGTKLALTYAVAGYMKAGMNTWAGGVDAVLKDQFKRLKNLVEHGDPAPH